MNGFYLERGERGLLIGQTGSGKTVDAIYQLRQSEIFPAIIFDTKIEDAFLGLPESDAEHLELVESLPALAEIAKRKVKYRPDYIVVRPSEVDMLNPESMDAYSYFVYNNFGACTIYYDEIYNWHDNGRAGPGLLGLLTRGRSRGKTTLMATQRPAWISRFCLTEAQKFYVHFLGDARDKKTLSGVIPNFHLYPDPGKHQFYHFQVGMRKPVLMQPVPHQAIGRPRVTKNRWY